VKFEYASVLLGGIFINRLIARAQQDDVKKRPIGAISSPLRRHVILHYQTSGMIVMMVLLGGAPAFSAPSSATFLIPVNQAGAVHEGSAAALLADNEIRNRYCAV
jgi:hypothetical protein